MSFTPTLLLSRRYTHDSNLLWRAASEAGWQIERLFSYDASHLKGKGPFAFYGETLLADGVRDTLGLRFIEPKPAWLSDLPAHYLKRDVFLTTFKDAVDIQRVCFMKPADDKTFPAAVYKSGRELDSYKVDSFNPVLVSEPVTFEAEYRCFILERSIVALSNPYTKGEDVLVADLEGAQLFLESMLADPTVDIPPAVVVDVGLMERGWAVVEANPLWGSGIYDCDPAAVLPALLRATNATYDDDRWVR